MRLPRMVEVEQRLYAKRVGDVPSAVAAAWRQAGCARGIRAGDQIAITVGSRGVDNIVAIIATLVELARAAGGRPFIIPAMGSHGGATAAGQTELLASLGVTPESVGAPIRASMAAVQVGETDLGTPVFVAREALRADGVVLVNRVKQHTDFTGECESGLVKMLAIGLGKRTGAAAVHARGCPGLRREVPQAAGILLRRLRVTGGIALLENGRHETADIIGVAPGDILSTEKRLLARARRNAGRLPFRNIDILIVDWIGKDISGVGFDTHVLGRRMIWGEPEFQGARARVVAALDLTPGSHGNGLGVGLADLVTERLARKIDWGVVRTNVLHTGFLNRAKLPLALPTDRKLIETAMFAAGDLDGARVRMVRIADTLQLGRLWASEALLPEVQRHPRLRAIGRPVALRFDSRGDLERLPR